MAKYLWLRRRNGWPLWGLRFGRPEHKLFSERWEGTRGIPRRHFNLLGDRLTLIRGRKPE